MSFSLPPVLTTPWLQVWLLPLAGMTLFQCLVAIWAANSRRHWFLRALAVWAAVALMIPIATWEPAWVYAVALPLVVVLLKTFVGRAAKSATEADFLASPRPRESFRFSTRDLFLLMLFVGLCLMALLEVARHGFPESIAGWLVASASLAIVASLTYGVAAGPRRVRAALLLVCILPAVAAANWATGDWMRLWMMLGASRGILATDVLELTILIAEFTLLLLAVLALPRVVAHSRSMIRRRAAASALTVVVLAAGVPTAAVYFWLARPLREPPRFATPTNHYNRILAIANELHTAAPQQVEPLYAELFTLLEAPNAVAYDPELHAGDPAFEAEYMPTIQAFKSLGRMLKAEGDAARVLDQPQRTAECAVALMRLGAMLQRGGLELHVLAGSNQEIMAYDQLASIRADLAVEELRPTIEALQRTTAEREDINAIDARNLHNYFTSDGWHARLEVIAVGLFADGYPWYHIHNASSKRAAAGNALLQTEFAIRLFEHDHSRLPSELGELVPNYLPAVPLDPHSNQPLRYRVQDDAFVLYSVGHDGKDDGGRFGNRRTVLESGFDYDVDTGIRP